jgi:hypothetical protein
MILGTKEWKLFCSQISGPILSNSSHFHEVANFALQEKWLHEWASDFISADKICQEPNSITEVYS